MNKLFQWVIALISNILAYLNEVRCKWKMRKHSKVYKIDLLIKDIDSHEILSRSEEEKNYEQEKEQT